MSTLHYGDLLFDDSFLFARRGDEEIRFTRQERALLSALTRSPRRLLRREALLDCLSEVGSDASDRNIDFLVNRLRAKLGDAARSPTYIATQYGEGYVWIAERADQKPLEAFLVLGPVFGLGAGARGDERRFLERIRRTLDGRVPPAERVVMAEAWQPGGGHKVRYNLEASFHADALGLHCAIILRDGATRQILHARRLVLADEVSALEAQADDLALAVRTQIWDRIARPDARFIAPTDQPLELRVHNASVLLAGRDQSWLESGAQLAKARAENPGDPRTALMWGMHLYSRIMSGGMAGIPIPERRRVEREIEALVFEFLPAIQGDPILMLGAAKLLFYIHRGHLELAEALAAEAFSQSTAFAAAFPIMGQIKASRGHFLEAVSLYDRGIELSEPGSDFHVYILVLKCTALLASGDLDAWELAEHALHVARPAARLGFGILSVRSDRPLPDDFARVLEMLDERRARILVSFLYNNSARLFVHQEHRDNVMRSFVAHVARRFGAALVEDELAKAKAAD